MSRRPGAGLPRLLAACLAACLCLAPLGAEEGGPPAAPAPGALDEGGEGALRRFEIIALGSFPISLLYTNFGFDLGSYAASGFDADYAPWPFASARGASLTDGQRLLRIGVAAGLSLGVAALDALLLPRSRARREALRGLGPLPPAPPSELPAGPGSPLPGLPEPGALPEAP